MIAGKITELVGKTPMIRLESFSKNISAKLEFFNPCSCVKERIALGMVIDAEDRGILKKGMTIVEPTSGNTGIGLAMVAAARGYKIILTMPETMSVERRKLLSHLGAEIVLTPGEKGMNGAVEKCRELVNSSSDFLTMDQFGNMANPETHYRTTGPEIWKDSDGKIDIFVAGVGTGGTITGVGKYLKEKNPKIKIVAVEPAESPVLSGGDPGPHRIQGIGAGFVPSILNQDIIDQVVTVTSDEAINFTRELPIMEGVAAGISSGANLGAALKISKMEENRGKEIVTLFPDTLERYLSVL